MRIHCLENVDKALQFLKEQRVHLENMGSHDIVDGNHRLTLGLIWTIILRFQVGLAVGALAFSLAPGILISPDVIFPAHLPAPPRCISRSFLLITFLNGFRSWIRVSVDKRIRGYGLCGYWGGGLPTVKGLLE